MTSSIAKVAVGLPVAGPFDYRIPGGLKGRAVLGARVKIIFGRTTRLGFIVGFAAKSAFKNLRPLSDVLDTRPLFTKADLTLCQNVADYYGCSLGEAMDVSLPVYLRNYRRTFEAERVTPDSKILESPEKVVVRSLTGMGLDDQVRSLVDRARQNKESVLVLVPEMSWIAGVAEEINQRYQTTCAVLDRSRKDADACEEWTRFWTGEAPFAVGTRSAVFARAPRLGLIVVLEEDNEAYRQEQSPHYDARRVAVLRSQAEKCSLVFSSRLPRVETWSEAGKRGWRRIEAEEAKDPVLIQMVDMTNYNPGKTSVVSFPLQNIIQKMLAERKTVLLYSDRKGFNTRTQCNECGNLVSCPRCDVPMVYYYAQKALVCPRCQSKQDLPKICPSCRGNYLRSKGSGAEKIESELARMFPQARVGLYDGKKTDAARYDIFLSTLAYLHRFENQRFDCVGIINIDRTLNRYDYQSGHHVLALLLRLEQCARERVIVQSRMIDHYVLTAYRQKRFDKFYKEEMKFRRQTGFPPSKTLVTIQVRGRKEDQTLETAGRLASRLQQVVPAGVDVSEAFPDAIHKMRDQYRFVVYCKGKNVRAMQAALKKSVKDIPRRSGIIISVHVDP